ARLPLDPDVLDAGRRAGGLAVDAHVPQREGLGRVRMPDQPFTSRFQGGSMAKVLSAVMLLLSVFANPAAGQAPPGPAATPSDYILLTVIMRHDQAKNLDEINKLQAESGFWARFPPEGIQIESWYIAMGLGYIVTLRVPPSRLREVNRAVEQTAWKAFRT